MRIIRTPIRAPRANAIAERFIGTLRRECLDHLLITGPRHLDVVLREYVQHFNTHRPHRHHCISTRPHAPLPQVPRRPSDRYDATGSAASSTNTSWSHKVTRLLGTHTFKCVLGSATVWSNCLTMIRTPLRASTDR